ncbi:MAG: hypothetical protein KKB20_21425 [Proteobacteria bacterium]|nr:hypothetical protein [Pseudomonadota bacterium]
MTDQNSKYYFCKQNAQAAIEAMERGASRVELSMDLNLTHGSFEINQDALILDPGNRIDKPDLRAIAQKDNKVFVLEDNALRILEYGDHYYYKLVPTDFAPTLEISGIRMHRSKDYDPFRDAELKAREAVRPGDAVLDTCGGLGYTAIWAARIGAGAVVSVEVDEYVRKIRRENPWSRPLYEERIVLVEQDVAEYIQTVPSGACDSIIHDPPRFSRAGELYGGVFYSELYRVLKRQGRVFHYTGNPYVARRGDSFYLNAQKRLRKAGFNKVMPRPDLLGLLAVKT